MLRPGGRFAVCTSTLRQSLDSTVSWPVCMRMFADMHELPLLCEAAGLVDVCVDDSDAAMEFEIDAEADAKTARQRNAVHVGSPEFQHLQKFDMNALCARVIVTGRRPL